MGTERIKPIYYKTKEKIQEAVKKKVTAAQESVLFIAKDASPLLDPPLTRQQMREREDYMMDIGNWREDHSVPSEGPHYRYMWKWDSNKGIVINARREQPDKAALELLTLEKHRDPSTGFLSNKIFATAEGKKWCDYPEVLYFSRPDVGSSYTQPSLQAWAAMETYQSFARQGRDADGKKFLEKMYGSDTPGHYSGLKGEHAYFRNHRQNDNNDPLIGIVHPHETGRDSDRANKPFAKSIPNKGTVSTFFDTAIQWIEMEKFGHDVGKLGSDPENKRVDWIPENVRKKYWINDVMFNALYANDLRYMAEIGKILEKPKVEQDQFTQQADKLEQQILTKMWDPDKGFFYNLDKNGQKVQVDSVTGLFPLLLKTISKTQLQALREKLNDPTWFGTNYPLPTHAARSKFYDPHFTRKNAPPWEGPVWLDMNYFIVEEGLMKQAERFANPKSQEYDPGLASLLVRDAKPIVESTEKLLGMNQYTYECYDPENGKGYRVRKFMWSNLGLHFNAYETMKKREL